MSVYWFLVSCNFWYLDCSICSLLLQLKVLNFLIWFIWFHFNLIQWELQKECIKHMISLLYIFTTGWSHSGGTIVLFSVGNSVSNVVSICFPFEWITDEIASVQFRNSSSVSAHNLIHFSPTATYYKIYIRITFVYIYIYIYIKIL